jgi:hypothetical protein
MAVPRWLFFYLWIAPHALQAVLAIVMIRRRLLQQFPAFFAYTVYEVVQFLVLFTMDQFDSVPQIQWGTTEIIGRTGSMILRFVVVHEIFENVFQSYPALKAFGGVVFRWATVVLMIIAVTVVGYSAGTDLNRFTVVYTILDRAVSIVQCGLLVLLVLLARFLSFPWTSYAFGIALGLGFFASVDLGIAALRAQYGLALAAEITDPISMATYHCCVLFWVVTLLRPERVIGRVGSPPNQELEHWNSALQRLLQQ